MRINAGCLQESEAGRFLLYLYEKTPAFNQFTASERSGFPHDGKRHSLILNLKRRDAEAFLERIKKDHGTMRGCTEFIAHVRSRMN